MRAFFYRFLILLSPVIVISSVQAAELPTIDEILTAQIKRDERLRNFEVRFEKIRALSEVIEDRNQAPPEPLPGFLRFENQHFYSEEKLPLVHEPRGRMPGDPPPREGDDDTRIEWLDLKRSWDGEQAMHQSKDYEGMVTISPSDRPQHNASMLMDHPWLFFFEFKLVNDGYFKMTPGSYQVVGTEKWQDRTAIAVEQNQPGEKNGMVVMRLLFDEEDLTPLRCDYRYGDDLSRYAEMMRDPDWLQRQGQPFAEWDIDYDLFGKEKRPKRWTATMYASNGSIQDSITTTAHEFKVNQDFKSEDFQLPLASSDRVALPRKFPEYDLGQVQPDGSVHVITTGLSLISGAPIADGNEKQAANSTDDKPTSLSQWLLLGSLGILIVAVGGYFLRRRPGPNET